MRSKIDSIIWSHINTIQKSQNFMVYYFAMNFSLPLCTKSIVWPIALQSALFCPRLHCLPPFFLCFDPRFARIKSRKTVEDCCNRRAETALSRARVKITISYRLQYERVERFKVVPNPLLVRHRFGSTSSHMLVMTNILWYEWYNCCDCHGWKVLTNRTEISSEMCIHKGCTYIKKHSELTSWRRLLT
jgi:hypothetical protein